MQELAMHTNHQRMFVRAAMMLLKVGGVLVFSTCTTNCLENEANVKWMLENFAGLQLVKAGPIVGGEGEGPV